MTVESLGELRSVQLGILLQFHRLCRTEGLTYYLAYGTLLGAVRHGGYIPWDDDIDVMMPRADFQRLVDSFASVAPQQLSLGSPRTRAGWPLPYAKLIDDRTRLVEPFQEPVALGVNIDVFPLDALPSNRLRLGGQSLALRVLGWALELKYVAAWRGRAWHHRFAVDVVKPLLRLVPIAVLVGAVDALARRTGPKPSRRVGVRAAASQWSVPASCLGNPVGLAFEGHLLSAPRDPHAVLAAHFGEDYLVLPPEVQRVSEHAFTWSWRNP